MTITVSKHTQDKKESLEMQFLSDSALKLAYSFCKKLCHKVSNYFIYLDAFLTV